MRAFGWWLMLVALEVIGCLVLALVSARMGYPDAGAAFVRCAWVLASVGLVSMAGAVVALAVIKIRGGVRVRAGKPRFAPGRESRMSSRVSR